MKYQRILPMFFIVRWKWFVSFLEIIKNKNQVITENFVNEYIY